MASMAPDPSSLIGRTTCVLLASVNGPWALLCWTWTLFYCFLFTMMCGACPGCGLSTFCEANIWWWLSFAAGKGRGRAGKMGWMGREDRSNGKYGKKGERGARRSEGFVVCLLALATLGAALRWYCPRNRDTLHNIALYKFPIFYSILFYSRGGERGPQSLTSCFRLGGRRGLTAAWRQCRIKSLPHEKSAEGRKYHTMQYRLYYTFPPPANRRLFTVWSVAKSCEQNNFTGMKSPGRFFPVNTIVFAGGDFSRGRSYNGKPALAVTINQSIYLYLYQVIKTHFVVYNVIVFVNIQERCTRTFCVNAPATTGRYYHASVAAAATSRWWQQLMMMMIMMRFSWFMFWFI